MTQEEIESLVLDKQDYYSFRLDHISNLDQDILESNKDEILNEIAAAWRYYLEKSIDDDTSEKIVIALIVTFYLAEPWLYKSYFEFSFNAINWIGIYIFSILILALIIALYIFLDYLFRSTDRKKETRWKRMPRYRLSIYFLILLVSTYIHISIVTGTTPINLKLPINYALINATGVIIFSAFVLLIRLLITTINIYRINKHIQKEFYKYKIIEKTIYALEILDKEDEFYKNIKKQNSIIVVNEYIAHVFKNVISRNYKLKNEELKLWSRDFFNSIGRSIEEKNKLIIEMKYSTINELVKFYNSLIKNTLSGRLSYVERSTVLEETKQGRKHALKILIMRFVSASLPLAIVLLVIILFPKKDDYYTYFLIGSVIWMIISILSMIDPDFKEKISALKDAVDIVSGKGKK